MAYTLFDPTVPVPTQDGIEAVDSMRSNGQALADGVAIVGMPFCNVVASQPYSEPPTVTYTNGDYVTRVNYTYVDGVVTTYFVEASVDGGSNFDPVGTATIAYDASGDFISSTWS